MPQEVKIIDMLVPQDCYFAILTKADEEYSVVLVSKKYWDEYGEVEESLQFNLDKFPNFLSSTPIGLAEYEPDDNNVQFDDLVDLMIKSKFQYNLELQAHLNQTNQQQDEEEYCEEDAFFYEAPNFWDILNPSVTL